LVAFRQTRVGPALDPFWSAIGVHREAEFAKDHTPAFYRGEDPRGYVCVYPFVRSYEWYLLPPRERAEMLSEHGQMAREYPQVRANTVSSFALGDYEWLLAFEADELPPIVDLMRHLRAAKAREHTRHELPFITGRRRPLADAIADLP
jgi:chlorite dismutase